MQIEPMIKSMGILGGSFDPIHFGHLWVAQQALETQKFDQIRIIPASQAPMRSDSPLATPEQRLEMIRLSVQNIPEFIVDEREIHSGVINFSIDTALSLKSDFPKSELSWIIGEDQLGKLNEWKSLDQLSKILNFIVARRPGSRSLNRKEPWIHYMNDRSIDISSTEIRKRIRNGQSIDFFLPQTVQQYIQKNKIYL